jgi:hypothetical protein
MGDYVKKSMNSDWTPPLGILKVRVRFTVTGAAW